MAKILGCSTHTVQSLETGRLRVSEATALKMEEQTGISAHWVRNAKPDAPPVGMYGDPYSKASYERVRRFRGNLQSLSDREFSFRFLVDAARLRSILERANQENAYIEAALKLNKFLNRLGEDYGVNVADWDRVAPMVSAIKKDIQRWPRPVSHLPWETPAKRRNSPKKRR